MKAAFIDRDGTINKDYEDEKWRYVKDPEIIEGSIEALKEIRKKGYQIIIITNQYMINDGIITVDQYSQFTDKLIGKLNDNGVDILDIFFCPHSKSENCSCCKPETGLVEMALKKHPDIDLSKSFFVGDSLCDVEMGNRLGIKTFGIGVESEFFKYTKLSCFYEIINYLKH